MNVDKFLIRETSMKLFEHLNNEICEETSGVYAPYYFRFLGYRKDIAARPSVFRANGIYALFTETQPVIMRNELIAGNRKSLHTNADKKVLEFAAKTVQLFGERNFPTNKDHYAPDYRRILQAGLPGLIEEIDASLEKYKDDAGKCETLTAMRHTLCGF
jgi:hypothetical protein